MAIASADHAKTDQCMSRTLRAGRLFRLFSGGSATGYRTQRVDKDRSALGTFLIGERERWSHPQAIAIQATLANEEPVFTALLENCSGRGRIRFAAVGAYELNADHETLTPNIADDG